MVKHLPRGLLPVVGGYFLAWTLVGLFFVTRDLSRRVYLNEPIDWERALTVWLVGEYIWGVVALAVIWFGVKWPLERAAITPRIGLHLLLSALVAAGQLALEAAAYKQLGTLTPSSAQSFWRAWSALLIVGFHGNVISYWVILGVHTGYRHYKKLEERERHALRLELQASELGTQLIRARLSALKMQLQPHFLFNTLNAIMVLVRQRRTDRAEEMIGRLSDLLRCVLDEAEAQEVPLHRELDYVRLYLSIEQVRFDERLRVAIAADPAVLDAAVPHMALQPIVENALRHGIARSARGGTIRVTASAVDASVVIQVSDDGAGFESQNLSDHRGIGLANTRARLAQLYGDAATLRIEPGLPGAIVTVTLPYRQVQHLAAQETLDAVHVAHR
jgi:two-component system, LytTR family, sensor kinase